MVDFVFCFCNAFRTSDELRNFQNLNFFLVGGGFFSPPRLRPWSPSAFGMRTLVSLVSIWIRFAKISSRFFASPQFTVNHINHISKIKNPTKKLMNSKIRVGTLPMSHFCSVMHNFFFRFLNDYICFLKSHDYISKNENHKNWRNLIFHSFQHIAHLSWKSDLRGGWVWLSLPIKDLHWKYHIKFYQTTTSFYSIERFGVNTKQIIST